MCFYYFAPSLREQASGLCNERVDPTSEVEGQLHSLWLADWLGAGRRSGKREEGGGEKFRQGDAQRFSQRGEKL